MRLSVFLFAHAMLAPSSVTVLSTVNVIISFEFNGRLNFRPCVQPLFSFTNSLHFINLGLDFCDSSVQTSRHEYVLVVRILVPSATSRDPHYLIHLDNNYAKLCFAA